MTKACAIQTVNSNEMRIRAGAKGKGRIVKAVNFWPEHSDSVSDAREMLFEAARSERFTHCHVFNLTGSGDIDIIEL